MNQHLQLVIEKLREYGLVINHSKSMLGLPQVNFLGFSSGFSPPEERVHTIRNFKLPTRASDLRRFLSMVNFFRRILPCPAEKQMTLFKFLKGNNKNDTSTVEWTDEAKEAFQQCKNDLCKATLLAYPKPGAQLSLTVDASGTAVGAVLQQHDNDQWQPLGFYSERLTETQTRYNTYDRELLAAYKAVKYFQHMLEQKIYQPH